MADKYWLKQDGKEQGQPKAEVNDDYYFASLQS